MIALVTGFRGFIGTNLREGLIEEGYKIYGIEKDRVKYFIENPEAFENMVSGVDIIFHNGAISDTSSSDYQEMLYYNYHFTKILVDLAKKYGKKVIYASSASVYGDGGEHDVPSNIYAWSKMLAEEYGRLSYPEGFTALRYFNVYGPHEEHKGKMASIGYQAFRYKYPDIPFLATNTWENPFKLFPKEPQRDFVYVKDVVSANICAIDAPTGVYEVGTGEARKFESFLENMRVEYTHTSEGMIPEWYQFFTQANPDNFLPNWNPKYDLETGCEDYLTYLNNGEKESSSDRGDV